MIHLESIQSLPKQIDYMDSLVDKYLAPTPDNADTASVLEREELSSIYLEVTSNFYSVFFMKDVDNEFFSFFVLLL